MKRYSILGIILIGLFLCMAGTVNAQSSVPIRGNTTVPTVDSVCFAPEVRVIPDTGGTYQCKCTAGSNCTWIQPKVEIVAHALIKTVTAAEAFVFRMPPFAGTVTGVYCSVEAATNAIIEICAEDDIDGTCTTDVLTSTNQLTCTVGEGANDITSLGGNPFASLDQYTIYIVSISGTPTNLDITMIGVRN